jgi:hypothetical protein
LKVDLVCSLRAAIDHANASLIDGNSADLSRLVSAVEQLTKLLPARSLNLRCQRAAIRARLCCG